jgi:small-conductance mechanosensitive channel
MTQQLIYLVGAKTLKIIGYLIGSQVLIQVIRALSKKIRSATKQLGKKNLIQQEARVQTMRNLIVSSARIVINFIVIVMILAELGADITPLLTGAGIIGLAVGFGAKNLVSDLIAGFFFIIENQFNIGDMVQIGSSTGKVVRLTLRTVTLRDEEKKIHIIPNSNVKFLIKYPPKEKKKKR